MDFALITIRGALDGFYKLLALSPACGWAICVVNKLLV